MRMTPGIEDMSFFIYNMEYTDLLINNTVKLVTMILVHRIECNKLHSIIKGSLIIPQTTNSIASKIN